MKVDLNKISLMDRESSIPSKDKRYLEYGGKEFFDVLNRL
jgi:hypothetical protein